MKLKKLTETQAIDALIIAATKMTKEARWGPYRSKINELRIPLIQLKYARR